MCEGGFFHYDFSFFAKRQAVQITYFFSGDLGCSPFKKQARSPLPSKGGMGSGVLSAVSPLRPDLGKDAPSGAGSPGPEIAGD